MLAYDPVPWLMIQDGLPALRARCRLGLQREDDPQDARIYTRELVGEQLADGSFEHSPMRTAGVLSVLADLHLLDAPVVAAAAGYLFAILASQPGYAQVEGIVPGGLDTPCDLGGFFGPYQDRNRPEVRAAGAKELNAYREYEPLLGPKSPVRAVPRSSLDRGGPSSCYAWGLIPLSYIVSALCAAGYAQDPRLLPALNVLLGVQRASGGWCRNLGGHPSCTVHGLVALGGHPTLCRSDYAVRALGLLLRDGQRLDRFTVLHLAASFDLPVARELIQHVLESVLSRQRRNGSFGTPYPVERVAAVVAALKTLGQ